MSSPICDESLKVTNKNWIRLDTNSDKRIVMTCNVGDIKKPINEDADIAMVVMYVDTSIQLSKNNGHDMFNVVLDLKNSKFSMWIVKFIIKICNIFTKKYEDILYKFDIYNAPKFGKKLWDLVKGSIDPDTVKKINIHTDNGSTIPIESAQYDLAYNQEDIAVN